MSLARPFAALRSRALAVTRSASTSAAIPTPTPTSSNTPSASSSTSAYPSTAVPRLPDYPTHFPSSPQHQHYNHPHRLFSPPDKAAFPEVLGENTAQKNEQLLASVTGLTRDQVRGLNRYGVVLKRVVNMTKKGKQPSFFAMMVVGSPERGLVGIGRGRGANVSAAMDQGFHKAVLSMDYVNKFESRTLWGSGADLKYKWGSTTVIMRARPPGFGLQVPHAIHRLFSACGIRDASATIEGSRNPVQVLKCALQILHGGFGPPGFGSGTGKTGRREDKGAGMRSVQDVERERGRYGVDVGKRI